MAILLALGFLLSPELTCFSRAFRAHDRAPRALAVCSIICSVHPSLLSCSESAIGVDTQVETCQTVSGGYAAASRSDERLLASDFSHISGRKTVFEQASNNKNLQKILAHRLSGRCTLKVVSDTDLCIVLEENNDIKEIIVASFQPRM